MNERRAMRYTESQQHERRVARLESLREYGGFAVFVDTVGVQPVSVSPRKHSSGGTAVRTKLELTDPRAEGAAAGECLMTMKGFAVLRRGHQQAVDELNVQLITFSEDVGLAVTEAGAQNGLAIILRVDGEQTSGWSITSASVHGFIVPAFGGFVAWLGRVERPMPAQIYSQDLYEYIARTQRKRGDNLKPRVGENNAHAT
jgi:hypothetical protein